MSPRGVAIPDIREQLFAAAERVLAHDGPAALSSRMIAREAGVATGLLYRHFTDLDGFLIEFIADRRKSALQFVEILLTQAGAGSVAGNLTAAAVALGSTAAPVLRLVTSQPALLRHMHAGHTAGPPVLHEIERAFAAYIERERELGRIRADADVETLALGLVAIWHHLLMTRRADGLPRAIDLLLANVTA